MLRTRFVVFAIALLVGCGVNPVTGKKEFNLVGEETELKIGAEQYVPSRQMQGGDLAVDPELTRYVSEIGQKLAGASDRKLPYEFSVLNNSVPNAWALPGGKIAVNRGLLTQLNSEAELAAVLGHEITHAAARHGAKSMERGMFMQGAVMALAIGTHDNQYANMIVGGAMVGAQLVTQRYGREAELEADHYGMVYMKRAGYDPGAAIDLQQTFVKLEQGKKAGWAEGLLASHPPSQERVDKNRETAAKLGAGGDLGRDRYQKVMANLRRDDAAYKKYDEGVAALNKGDDAKALGLAQEAAKIEPREGKFAELMGDVELKRKNYKAALDHYQRSLALNGGYFKPYLQSAIARYQLGERDQAKALFTRSMELLPTATASYYLGRYAQDAGDTEQALKYYQLAAGSDSEVGKESARQAAVLDLPRNPGNYLAAEARVDKNGQLLIAIQNRAQVPVRAVELRVAITNPAGQALQGPVRLTSGTRTIAAGQIIEIPTGLAPITTQAELAAVRWQFDKAAVAQ
ncbi:MAG TPA: M48 family metalloprotease [Steroidobacteraceae bacterium]|nr:M48 family metalloprotease [Steroidobacteraceae bacterium]